MPRTAAIHGKRAIVEQIHIAGIVDRGESGASTRCNGKLSPRTVNVIAREIYRPEGIVGWLHAC